MSLYRQSILFVLCAGVLMLAGSVSSVETKTSGDDLTVYGSAVFYNRPELDSVVLVDFPFTLSRHEFEFHRPDSLAVDYEARIYARLTVYGVDGLAVDSADTYFSTVVGSQTESLVKGYRLFNSISLLLKPGVYSGCLTVTDVTSKRDGKVTYNKIIVEPPRRSGLAIGGKCLAYSISYVGDDATGDRLVRNGFRVLTNPLRVFGEQDTAMFLYAEVYNLTWSPQDTSGFETEYVILDEAENVYRDFGAATFPKPGTMAVIAKSFSIAGWPAALYRLRMIARDMTSKQADTAVIAFSIVSAQPMPVIASGSLNADPLDTLPLEIQMHLVNYLLTPVERSTLSGLTDAGKQSFIRQYWLEHDSDPTTGVIENRRQMYERYLMCNHLYSRDETKTDGWETDRGRIYMVYGPWDTRDDVQAPRTGKPFDIWYYHSIQEGVVFVFEDTRGDGDYRLVHSTADGERFNASWNEIVKNGDFNLN